MRRMLRYALIGLAGVAALGGAVAALLSGGAMLFEGGRPAAHAADHMIINGQSLMVALDGTKTARVYRGQALLGVVRGHDGPIVAARFVEAGGAVMTTDRDGSVWVTELSRLSMIPAIEREHLEGVRSTVWAPLGAPAHSVMMTAAEQTGAETRRLLRLARLRLFSGALAPWWHQPGLRFRDCEGCPEMIVIPEGRFTMGSPDGEDGRDADEGPQREVAVARFALGVSEITREEYARFVDDTDREQQGCYTLTSGTNFELVETADWRSPGFPQDEDHPAVCISWEDAQAYVEWLNGQVEGAPYRLPSEAEMEYVIRAGTTDAYAWGDDPNAGCAHSNGLDQTGGARFEEFSTSECSDRHIFTAPVGSFQENAFGLYDIVGNVIEWTGDCWNDSYLGAPADGAAWTEGDCSRAVLRGGAWLQQPTIDLRSALRFRQAYRD